MDKTTKAKRPRLQLTAISAGFPNPAEDAGDLPLDLNKLVNKHPASTFYMRVEGDSMEGAGIFTDDLIVVDKSLQARSGDIVVAYINGEFTLKTFYKRGKNGKLIAANPHYKPLEITEDSDFQIWGVVTHVLRQLKRREAHD